jgi:hypothetical protein
MTAVFAGVLIGGRLLAGRIAIGHWVAERIDVRIDLE